jgi:RHS repeat-associated protein
MNILLTFLLFLLAIVKPIFGIERIDKTAHGKETPHNKSPDESSLNTSAITLGSGPSAIVAGCVNAISGGYFESSADLVYPGPQPFIVQRNYCTSDNEWNFNYMPALKVSKSQGKHHIDAFYTDENGSGLPYRASLNSFKEPNDNLRIIPEACKYLTNCCGGEISGRSNWSNSYIRFIRHEKEKYYQLILGSGAVRVFECRKLKGKDHEKGVIQGKFHLIEEASPNGNKFTYQYNSDDELQIVNATNSKGLHIAKLNRSLKKIGSEYTVETWSAGVLNIEYLFKNNRLISSNPSHALSTSYDYKYEGGLLNITKSQENNRYLKLEAALYGRIEDCKFRVKNLYAPVSTDASPIPIYSFEYHDNEKLPYTSVWDVNGTLLNYYYQRKNKKLESIVRYKKDETPYSKENFYWMRPNDLSEDLLQSCTFVGDGKTYFCKHFEYDGFGNITAEQLLGNLTGRNSTSIIVTNGIPDQKGCEVYTKNFEHTQTDGRNLLTFEDDGRKSIYLSYYQNSNLLKSRLTKCTEQKKRKNFYADTFGFLKREFFEYDQNGVLIREIWDDGSEFESADLSKVSERHIRIIKPSKKAPIGLPEEIQEKYYDLNTHQEILLKRIGNVFDDAGRIITQTHYGSDNVAAYTLYWDYDNLGNITKETNAFGDIIKREYDSNGNKTSERLFIKTDSGDKEHYFKKYTYDFSNRLIKEEEFWPSSDSFVTKHSYNLSGQKVKTIDSYGHETVFSYDEFGQQTQITYPEVVYKTNKTSTWIKPEERTAYNAMGQAVHHWDRNNSCTLRKYTIRGQPYEIEYPNGSKEKKEYTLDGLLEKVISKNGTVTTYTYDHFGRVLNTVIKDSKGVLIKGTSATYNAFHMLTETNELGAVTYYTYDGAGRKIGKKRRENVTKYSYDALGRINNETNGNILTTKKYDCADRIIEECIYDATNSTCIKKEEFAYDVNGNCIKSIVYNQAGTAITSSQFNPHNEPISTTDALGNTTYFSYKRIPIDDENGKQCKEVTRTDFLSNLDIKRYDSLGRIYLELRKNCDGHTVQQTNHEYDSEGNRLRTEYAVYEYPDRLSRIVTNEWEYDRLGNIVHCIEAKGSNEEKHTHYSFNRFGQREKISKPDSVILNYSYDSFGRVERIKSSDNTVHYTYCYDAKDNIIKCEDLILHTATEKNFDSYNRLESESIGEHFSLNYSYDALDRLQTISFPDKTSVEYTYQANQLKAVTRLKNGGTVYTYLYKTYDNAGNVLKVHLPGNAGSISYQYDLLERIHETTAPHWKETIPEDGYDAEGNLLERYVEDINGALNYTYTYDDLYQLTSEAGFDPHAYTNDSLFNRIAKDGNPYEINNLNQLLSQTDSRYTYYANGNTKEIINDEKTILLKYDALDRLIEVQIGDDTTYYKYDGFHRRLSKTQSGKTTYFLYQGDNEIGILVNGEIKELRILGLGKGAEIGATVAMEFNGSTYVPVHDPSGSVVSLLDLSGDVLESYRYTAFGEEEGGEKLNPWRFASKRVDPETGFINFGRRYYMPCVGRWLTPDPIGFADGPNLYTYCHNDPIAYVDPDGQFAFLLAPLAMMALEPFLPTISTYLGQYAGGAALASCLTSFVKGYNDPIDLVLMGNINSPGALAAGLIGAYLGGAKNIITAGGKKLCLEVGTQQLVKSLAEREVATLATRRISSFATNKTLNYTVQKSALQATKSNIVTPRAFTRSNQSLNSQFVRDANKFNGLNGYTKHGLNQAIGRDLGKGVNLKDMFQALKQPNQIIKQTNGAIKYIGNKATVVLNSEGKIVTTFGSTRGPQIWDLSGVIQP